MTHHKAVMAIFEAAIRGQTASRRRLLIPRVLTAVLLISDLLAVTAVTWSRAPDGAVAVFALACAVGIALFGGYDTRFLGQLDHALPRVFAVLAIAVLPVAALFGDAAVSSILQSFPLLVPIVLLVHGAIAVALARVHKRARPIEAAVIVGAGTTAVQLVRHLLAHREYGIEPIGFVDRVDDHDLPLPVLGDVDEIERILDMSGARHLLVAFGVVPEVDLVQTLRRHQLGNVDVWVIPRFFELGLHQSSGGAEEVWGIPMVRLPRRALRGAQWRLKRIFDVTLSAAGLILLAPTFAVIALAVRLTSPGPMFFRQERVGQRGRSFELLKFRTMLENDDSRTTWSVENDRRVTRVGRILRRTSLDELPQLLNVVRGDMSLVGPRPERPYFVEQFRGSVRGYDDRHRVPVGITGLAQVNGLRGDTSIEERAVFDNNYIENWTLWSDISILARTALAVVRNSREPQVGQELDLRERSPVLLPETAPDDPSVLVV